MHATIDGTAADVDKSSPVLFVTWFKVTIDRLVAAAIHRTVDLATTHIDGLGARVLVSHFNRDLFTAAKHILLHGAAIDIDHLFQRDKACITTAKHTSISSTALEEDTGAALYDTSGFGLVTAGISVDTTATAKHVTFILVATIETNRAVVNNHLGVLGNVTVFTATKHRTSDCSTIDDNFRILQIGQLGIIGTHQAFRAAIDIATTNGGVFIAYYHVAMDIHSGATAFGTVVVIGVSRDVATFRISTHTGHTATAIDRAVHLTATEVNEGVAVGSTRSDAELAANLVLTTTSTIHVAFVTRGAIDTDGTSCHKDMGILTHMAVFATAKHTTLYISVILNRDERVLHKGQFGENLLIAFSGRTTVSRTEHMAVFIAIGTNNTVLDDDVGSSREFSIVVFSNTHGSQVTTAIHVTVGLSTFDGDIGVELHPTGSAAVIAAEIQVGTAATAKDITHQDVV